MGTLFRVVIYAGGTEAADRAMRASFAKARELDEALSDYKPDSELNRLCRAGRMVASPDLFAVLEAAQRVSRDSRGAFDVTVGPLVDLWRQARLRGVLPEAAARREAMGRVGWRMVQLNRSTREVALRRAGMRIDLGGIGKGYAADEMLRTLRALGIDRALVAAGGDVVAGDPPPGRTGWSVKAGDQVLELANRAVSTSGDAEQFVEIGGVRYSHIVDPRTGLGLVGARQVSVVERSGMLADAWATARAVMGSRASSSRR
jgi:thiamine biosynthesis lipoprotein